MLYIYQIILKYYIFYIHVSSLNVIPTASIAAYVNLKPAKYLSLATNPIIAYNKFFSIKFS